MSQPKEVLKVLHLASFAGNIGDVANHAGARSMLASQLDFALECTELEIREFYWKKRAFDADFVAYANSFDLLLIGGGNYFELWVQESATGTSIDIAPTQLAGLTVPTIFFSLGVDTGQGYSQQSAQRFASFIRTVLSRRDMFVCVRNDGSSIALQEVLPAADAAQIPVMPDGGFFAGAAQWRHPAKMKNQLSIGINMAGDMLERRFDRGCSSTEFLRQLSSVCCSLLEEKPSLHIYLVPHIWRDVSLIAEMLPMIPDHFLRRRISISSLQPSVDGLGAFLDGYGSYDLVLGMRFHANVCPIGMGVPTRGLLNYPQVELLYRELDLADRLADVRVRGFERELLAGTLADLDDLQSLRAKYAERLNRLDDQAMRTLAEINSWIHSNRD
jgi:polysaccharide pyruvyl transferase WcaK-like protein